MFQRKRTQQVIAPDETVCTESMPELREKLTEAPSDPGVYLMKDERGKVIYVGKAGNLKKRLSSYFTRPDHPDLKTGILVSKIADFETIVTGTENDALVLESNLIKRHNPRYNVILKDGKRYPSLRLDPKAAYPALTLVRKTNKDGALYFGPFTAQGAVARTLKIINKTFKLRKCKDSVFKTRTRPCLNYQMGGCLGPCCLDVTQEEYGEIVKEVILFLKGRAPDLLQKIRKEMAKAAEKQEFEKAAQLRDRMFAIERTLEKQVIVSADFMDRDVLGLAAGPSRCVITCLSVRGGYLIDSRHFDLPETLASDQEIMEAFIRQHYESSGFVPKEILVPVLPENSALLENLLGELKGEKVSILHPQRGEKARLAEMAARNAEEELHRLTSLAEAGEDLLLRLQKRLRIFLVPERIECFDNSHLSGTNPVSAMVVFEKGKALKAAYRKYKIRTVTQPDDYAYMAEVLKRRYGKGEDSQPYPDLLMVDGGKGQLHIAVAVLKELGILGQFEIIGIAKKDESAGETEDKIYLPGRANPINFSRDADLLFFLQRIRDEAHRFVITFQRKRRGKTAVISALDSIPGVGKERKKALLKHFGSIKKIRAASPEELGNAPGISQHTAEAIYRAFRQNPVGSPPLREGQGEGENIIL